MNPILRFVVSVGLALLAPLALAAPPQTINYQGYLTNASGTPVNSPVVMTFMLYSALSGGSPLWTEVQPSVSITNGTLNTVLGSVTPLTLGTVPFDVPYFLEITIGTAPNAEILSPRQPLASSPYAFRAASLDSAATIPTSSLTGTIGTVNLATTQVLPTAPCAIGQISKWDGSKWACAADDTAAVAGGTAGQVLVGTGAAPAWTDSPLLNGNLTLTSPSTASTGTIMRGANRFIHNFGTDNTFIGEVAGNYTMTGTSNTAIGWAALNSDSSGDSNTATGFAALASNTTGDFNTANGVNALFSNIGGGGNTATGYQALLSNTSGSFNTASGQFALQGNTSGNFNTASGQGALYNNTSGINNTASGAGALFSNTFGANNTANGFQALGGNSTGVNNTASGQGALASNTGGNSNTASGQAALNKNITGTNNTASGAGSLFNNTVGDNNTASGQLALHSNTNGYFNTAIGQGALHGNTTGTNNTALGAGALFSNTGGIFNVAIGYNAGSNLAFGSDNIYIVNAGVPVEGNTIRIGDGNQSKTFITGIRDRSMAGPTTAVPVYINGDNQLGTITSSRRFKDDIRDMDDASVALMNLRPVTFHYKSDQNPAGRALQYGLIAEEVAEVYPGLVSLAADGQIQTVLYHYLPPMLLNEFQKQQRMIAAQAERISELESQSARVEMLARKLMNIEAMLEAR